MQQKVIKCYMMLPRLSYIYHRNIKTCAYSFYSITKKHSYYSSMDILTLNFNILDLHMVCKNIC